MGDIQLIHNHRLQNVVQKLKWRQRLTKRILLLNWILKITMIFLRNCVIIFQYYDNTSCLLHSIKTFHCPKVSRRFIAFGKEKSCIFELFLDQPRPSGDVRSNGPRARREGENYFNVKMWKRGITLLPLHGRGNQMYIDEIFLCKCITSYLHHPFLIPIEPSWDLT